MYSYGLQGQSNDEAQTRTISRDYIRGEKDDRNNRHLDFTHLSCRSHSMRGLVAVWLRVATSIDTNPDDGKGVCFTTSTQ
jgi:hypothetical protein